MFTRAGPHWTRPVLPLLLHGVVRVKRGESRSPERPGAWLMGSCCATWMTPGAHPSRSGFRNTDGQWKSARVSHSAGSPALVSPEAGVGSFPTERPRPPQILSLGKGAQAPQLWAAVGIPTGLPGQNDIGYPYGGSYVSGL